MMLLALFSSGAWAQFSGGNGSESNPYQISSSTDWNTLATNVNSGTSYSGKYFKLTSNITISGSTQNYMVGTMSGETSSGNAFSGNFNGDGHTITISYSTNSSFYYTAPFRYISGATIKNVKVAGTMNVYKFMGSLVGYCMGTNNIENCVSEVAITGTISGDATMGGLISHVHGGTTYIRGCVFKGKLLGSSSNCVGGFIGWTDHGSAYSEFYDCVFAPSQVTVSTTNSATFSRGNSSNTYGISVYNSYYTQTHGTTQGSKLQYTITAGSNVSTVALGNNPVEYNLSGITGYNSSSGYGIKYNNTIYAASGNSVKLDLSSTLTNPQYSASAGSLSGTSNPYTLSMTSSNTVISATDGGSGGGGGDGDCAEIGTVNTSNSSTSYGPVNDYYRYGYYQIIYPKDEVPTGDINSIGFNYAYTTAMSQKNNVTIYMGTTSANTLNDWMDVGTMTKVYTGNLNCTQQGWNDFALTTPYAYSGQENLVVVIMDQSGQYDGSNYKFYYATSSNNVNKYVYTDTQSNIAFPANDTGTPTVNGGTSDNKTYYPVTRFCATADSNCEDFESGSMPSGWTSEGTGSWVVKTGDYASSTGAHGGTYNVSRPHANRNEVCYLVMPAQDFSAVSSATLNFWYINRKWGSDIDYLDVCYRIGNGNWTSLWNTTTNHESWTEQSVNLTGLAANYQIGFKYTDKYGYDVSIDDVCIETTGGSTPTYITEIANVADWEAFCASVNSGLDYSSRTVTMTADVTTAVTTMAGTSSNPFKGTFDGKGHTLNVNLSSSSEGFVAPFHYVTGATIKNLQVTGSCVSSASGNTRRHNAGLVGSVQETGVTIENCLVTANVGSTSYRTDYCGGLIGHLGDNTVTIIGSAYTGTLYVSGTNVVGGLLGWGDTPSEVTITDCFFGGTYNNSSSGYFHPVGVANHANNISSSNLSISNCYYTYDPSNFSSSNTDKPIVVNSTNKGKHAYTITGGTNVTVANAGTATTYGGSTTSVHYITGYGTGIKYNNVLYAGQSENVSLTLNYSGSIPSGQELNGYTASNSGTLAASGNNYILTMPNNNTVINANITNIKIHIARNESSTQMTWDQFAAKVNGGTDYSGVEIFLDEDITISTQVGTSQTVCFNGIFNGKTHKLTLSGGAFGTSSSYASNRYVAPFRNINGTTIQNLVVDGSIYVSDKFAAGVASHAKGTNTITNCKVIATINSSMTGDGTHGGIVAHVEDGLTTITGCVFNGQLLGTGTTGTTSCGGIIGYTTSSDDVRINHCIFDPTNVTFSNSSSNPICRNTSASYITNCYYTSTALGTGFGKMRHTVTMGSGVSTMTMSGTATANNVSGITYYASNSGLLYNGTIIAGDGDNVSLTLTGASEYEADYGTLTGSGNSYTLAMPNRDVVISGLNCATPTAFTYTALGSTYVTLTWTAGDEEENWQVKYWANGDSEPADGQARSYSVTTDTITGLTLGVTYHAKVRAVCDAQNEEYSDWVQCDFTTSSKTFNNNSSFGDHNWSDPSNWNPIGVPTTDDDVTIAANVTIGNGVLAQAHNITNNATITIADGGQLWHNNTGVNLTIERAIAAYHQSNAQTNLGYKIISFPVSNLRPNSQYITGLLTSDHYDFYTFEYANQGEDDRYLEWMPVIAHYSNVGMDPYTGYLYASQEGTTIRVTGAVAPSSANSTHEFYVETGDEPFNGWYMVGNPFVCNAYLTANGGNLDFYEIEDYTQSGYAEFVLNDNTVAIPPMGGVMVRVHEDDDLVYSRTAPTNSKGGILNVNVNKVLSSKDGSAAETIDRARLRFGEGRNLEKLQLNPRHTKLYIPEGSKDYSVVYTEGAGSMPVNFKAENNGHYTLDFSTEDVNFNYLHLIDNMTGADVALLALRQAQGPATYTFNAKTTDYESRFKLVFAASDVDGSSTSSETFAFYSNGVWVVNNEGDATLQVVDINGRILSTDRISGATTKAINAASGIYMLRLINGDNVKVQKIVVR